MFLYQIITVIYPDTYSLISVLETQGTRIFNFPL